MVFPGVYFRVSDFHLIIGPYPKFVFPPTPGLKGISALYPLRHFASLK